jgi:hypothetical protein
MKASIMKHTKIITCIVALLASSFTVFNALADDGVVRAKVSLGYSNYTQPFGNNEITSYYTTQGLGITYIWPSNVFVDLTTKVSAKDASYNAKNVFGYKGVTSDQGFSRTENTLTLGKSTENGTQLNAGIFSAETVLNLSQFGQFSQKIMGLTAGAGKGFLIEDGRAGSIGVSGAFALLNAINKDNTGVSVNSYPSYGISLGAAYTYSLTKNVSVLADGKFQTYFIKYPTFSGDERILSGALSLLAQF